MQKLIEIATRYCFHPVGQGIFSSGRLEVVHSTGRPFWWVYDCGTVKGRQALVTAELSRLQQLVSGFPPPTGRPRLDVVFVSHFDWDHVSGLVELLMAFDVDTLVLPFIPLWQRLVVAVTSSDYGRPSYQAFMVNPVAFVASVQDGRVRRIILVPPSAEGRPPEGPDVNGDQADPFSNGLPDEIRPVIEPDRIVDAPDSHLIEEISIPANGQGPLIQWLAPGGRLEVGELLEFVPYNSPALYTRATPHFRLTVSRVAKALLTSTVPATTARILARLKSIYVRRFGSKSRQKNEISLFVYAGPLHRLLTRARLSRPVSALTNSPMMCDDDECPLCTEWVPTGDYRNAILYTGDGYLDKKQDCNALLGYLGSARMQALSVLQVMHHGSRKNWHAGLAAQLSPQHSVFCADRSYSHKHPHKEVENDFVPFGAVVVQRTEGFNLYQRLKA